MGGLQFEKLCAAPLTPSDVLATDGEEGRKDERVKLACRLRSLPPSSSTFPRERYLVLRSSPGMAGQEDGSRARQADGASFGEPYKVT